MAKNVNNTMKYVSLVTLTLQNAALGLSMTYSRSRAGELFLASTAVLMAEVVKLVTCLWLVFLEEGSTIKGLTSSLHSVIIQQPLDTLKVCVPSLVYMIQNNLLYVAASHLDAATYQVTYQLKILTTAVFAVTILGRKLGGHQWVALLILLVGVAMVQLAQTVEKGAEVVAALSVTETQPSKQRFLGFSAALMACMLSGFAGIYFEKILKGSNVSVWMRNIQLSLLSLPFGMIACFIYDHKGVSTNGFFNGYDAFVWFLVAQQAGGGLLVAVVVKYADNILKGFATSLAIVLSCIASIYLFNFQLTFQFTLGAAMVIGSVFLYSYILPTPKSTSVEKI